MKYFLMLLLGFFVVSSFGAAQKSEYLEPDAPVLGQGNIVMHQIENVVQYPFPDNPTVIFLIPDSHWNTCDIQQSCYGSVLRNPYVPTPQKRPVAYPTESAATSSVPGSSGSCHGVYWYPSNLPGTQPDLSNTRCGLGLR